MFYVYILRSEHTGGLYVGHTSDAARRERYPKSVAGSREKKRLAGLPVR